MPNPATGPLIGVHVADFSSFIAGSFAAMLLGDMGASVIKIEPPDGDLARAWAPFLNGESRFFQAWNRGKRSIAVDLTRSEGREIAHRLARRADIVIENYRRGVTRKLGIDYETLREINPRLIYCSSTAFGARGPLRDRPGYDPVLQCVSGAAADNARLNGGKVAISAVAVSDYQASMQIVAGALAALYRRDRTGEGQKVETSLLQAVMAVQAHYFVQALDCDEEGGVGIYPYRLLPTRDSQIFIATATDRFWRMFCEAIGAPELATNPRYRTNSLRVQAAAELTPVIESILQTKTTAEWEALLIERGVPCASVGTCREFLTDPQVEAMGMNPVIEHPAFGRLRMFGIPIDFERTPGTIQGPAPRMGEHTKEILEELGYTASQREDLRRDDIVGRQGPPA